MVIFFLLVSCSNGFHIMRVRTKELRLDAGCDESGVTFIHHKLFICLWLGHLFHSILYAGRF